MHEEKIIVLFDTDVLKARRLAREMAVGMGFDKYGVNEIETSISELATNLVKHNALNGEIAIRTVTNREHTGIELRAEDQGPGIRDITTAMKDGESTKISLGIGLPGVKRMMDEFSIQSEHGKGTLVAARKWLPSDFIQKMKVSVFSVPFPGQEVSGDAYFIKHTREGALLVVIDALGHGREAHETALQALEIIENNYTEPLLDLVMLCHKGLMHSRGAAIAFCKIAYAEKIMQHVSVGNVETRVYGSSVLVRPFCFNGTLGAAIRNVKVTEYPYREGSTIVMFSDGISGRFDLKSEMLGMSVQETASFILDNYKRSTDDATVLVGR